MTGECEWVRQVWAKWGVGVKCFHGPGRHSPFPRQATLIHPNNTSDILSFTNLRTHITLQQQAHIIARVCNWIFRSPETRNVNITWHGKVLTFGFDFWKNWISAFASWKYLHLENICILKIFASWKYLLLESILRILLWYLFLQDILNISCPFNQNYRKELKGTQSCRRQCCCLCWRRFQCKSPLLLLCWRRQGSQFREGFRGWILASLPSIQIPQSDWTGPPFLMVTGELG